MSAPNDLVEQGISAFNAGDKQQARHLLTQAVKEDRNNARAWYYLSQVQTDPTKRKQCLQMALKLDPTNSAAQAELASLSPEGASTPNTIGGTSASARAEKMSQGAMKAMRGAASTEAETPGLLSAIPGAPGKLSANYVIGFTAESLRNSLKLATTRQTDENASWWRFWLAVTVTGVMLSLCYILADIILDLRSDFYGVDAIAIIFRPLLITLTTMAGVYAGCFASYWYLAHSAGGQGSLLEHSYAQAVVWMPASLIMGLLVILSAIIDEAGVITLRYVLIGGSLSDLPSMTILFTLIAAGVTAFAIFLMGSNLARIHRISGAVPYIAAALMLAITSLVFYSSGIFTF